ncbi:MAG: pyrroloquinoline quinone biosynthesis peptide chaperone PqqD [Gammaproteobacteria bacterium]|nr:pyrroloquinoline quinone biosynthesis peptide chaperone PqqD [Gammaproteobacteria bacterium]
MSKSEGQLLCLAPGFRFQYEPAQESWVLLFPEGMVKLNGSAAEIMKHVDGSLTEAALIAKLGEQFPSAELADDVRGFLTEARSRGWLAA